MNCRVTENETKQWLMVIVVTGNLVQTLDFLRLSFCASRSGTSQTDRNTDMMSLLSWGVKQQRCNCVACGSVRRHVAKKAKRRATWRASCSWKMLRWSSETRSTVTWTQCRTRRDRAGQDTVPNSSLRLPPLPLSPRRLWRRTALPIGGLEHGDR